MAIRPTGQAPLQKQTQTLTIDSGAFDATTTYGISIGGVTISTIGITNADTTATNLHALLEAASETTGVIHPYFAAIDFTVATNVITATARNAGVPYVIVDATTGGTGTLTIATTTANSGPWSWDIAGNWSGAAVPVSTDDVVLSDSKIPLLFGLAQSGVTLATLQVFDTFQAAIGLRSGEFLTAVSSAGVLTYDASVSEYRDPALDIGWDDAWIGIRTGSVASNTSKHWHFDNAKAGANCTRVQSIPSSADDGKPAMTLKCAHASSTVIADGVTGRIGLGRHIPGETATFGDINWTGTSTVSGYDYGFDVTSTNALLNGGKHYVRAAAATTVTLVAAVNSDVTIEGDNFGITTTLVRGPDAIVRDHRVKASGNTVTTLQIQGGGTADMRGLGDSHTIGTVELSEGHLIDDTAGSWTTLTLDSPIKISVEPYEPS